MEQNHLIILSLLIGFLLDLLIGDPAWLPHPVRLFGKLTEWFEKGVNKGNKRLLKGVFVTIILVSTVFSFFYILLLQLESHPIIYVVVSSLFVFYGLSKRSLIDESRKVFKVLKEKGLESGRKQVSRIVGRETDQLSKNQVKVAVMETMSESLNDGVIAPLFFYAIGGVPAMMAYKMVNTLDSMIGFKNEKYMDFGLAAAKLDDLLNYIPARITAFLMALTSFNKRSFNYILRYGNQHASPNAGYPEAALAGILNCRFGGPNYYHGKLVSKPYIGEHDREIENSDMNRVQWLNVKVSLVFIGVVIASRLLVFFLISTF